MDDQEPANSGSDPATSDEAPAPTGVDGTSPAPEPEPEPSPAAEGEPGAPEPKRRRGWSIVGTLVGMVFVGIVLSIISNLISLPYYILSPGDAVSVGKYVTVPADKAFPPKGKLLLTSVLLARAHPFGIVWAWLTPNNEIDKAKDIVGNSSQKQYLKQNQDLMDTSKQTAIYAAFRRAGLAVGETGDGAEVAVVGPGSVATGKLHAGDTIVALNGKSVSTASELIAVTRLFKPGDAIHLDIVNSQGAKSSVDVTAGSDPRAPSAYLGIGVQTKNPGIKPSFPVDINTTNIGGPSAGLAFTLALLDDLTPGNLTGGQKVAVTGTINVDGTVGPVGGVVQKTAAVRASGAKLFIVPSDEYAAAKKHAGSSLKIVKADTLDQALQDLKDNGGDISGVPEPSPFAAPPSPTHR